MPVRSRQDFNSVTLLHLVTNIEKILSMIDVNPLEARAHSIEGYRWLFPWGTARIEVNVVERGGEGFFQVSAPLIHVPDTGRENLYRALLERNFELTSACMAIHEAVVYVFSERPLVGMDTEEARYLITQVAYYADELDNQLADEFGARLYQN